MVLRADCAASDCTEASTFFTRWSSSATRALRASSSVWRSVMSRTTPMTRAARRPVAVPRRDAGAVHPHHPPVVRADHAELDLVAASRQQASRDGRAVARRRRDGRSGRTPRRCSAGIAPAGRPVISAIRSLTISRSSLDLPLELAHPGGVERQAGALLLDGQLVGGVARLAGAFVHARQHRQ